MGIETGLRNPSRLLGKIGEPVDSGIQAGRVSDWSRMIPSHLIVVKGIRAESFAPGSAPGTGHRLRVLLSVPAPLPACQGEWSAGEDTRGPVRIDDGNWVGRVRRAPSEGPDLAAKPRRLVGAQDATADLVGGDQPAILVEGLSGSKAGPKKTPLGVFLILFRLGTGLFDHLFVMRIEGIIRLLEGGQGGRGQGEGGLVGRRGFRRIRPATFSEEEKEGETAKQSGYEFRHKETGGRNWVLG